MDSVVDAADLRARVSTWRSAGLRVAFVPTMGNLHAGHFSLLTRARAHADRVVASIFVNPTQFGPNEDFARYPRTPERDRNGLAAHGCDLLFAPAIEELYPFGTAASTRVEVAQVSEPLEGAMRPGHFVGVATVVTKLFNLVQPDVAVFGRKDYQQLLVIRRMVVDLRLPIDIVAAPIVREANGLAMSSRNQYLTVGERERAGVIHATLESMCEAVGAGQAVQTIEARAHAQLAAAGLVADYATLRRADDLAEARDLGPVPLVALIAARLGKTRLIDNVACGAPASADS
ncbi:MAG: pantoate--beta-alanine ligase [Rudaea sp.]